MSRNPPGFRFSGTDAIVVCIAVPVTFGLLHFVGSFAWLVPVVLGHFFLFCNVFRVRPSFELIWAAGFILNFVAWAMLADSIAWSRILLSQTPLTLLLLVFTILSPNYHGIAASRLRTSR